MNDRASQKPPTTYIGEDEFLSRYDDGDTRGRKMARPKTFMNHPNASAIVSTADRSEMSRHSGIFRFGKSIAATFNPGNWKIFAKTPQETEESEEQSTLRARREKAESMYQELKRSGYFRDSNFGPSLFQRPEERNPPSTRHDSGVDFGERKAGYDPRMSVETPRGEKRMGRIFVEPPPIPTGSEGHFSQSPASATQAAPKGIFHFKKPSLSTIKREGIDDAVEHRPLRRFPSRKDLHKQQKLVKRVSDLEGKLEAARRQLAEALDEPVLSGPPARRQPFIPGAMHSLPSERLLSAHCPSEDGLSESVSISQIGKAITTELLGPPTQQAPSPPDVDKSLPPEPDTPSHDRVMPSVEAVDDESVEIKEPSPETRSPLAQSVKSEQLQSVQQSATSPSALSEEESSSERSDSKDDDFEYAESGNHDTSPEPSEVSKISVPRPRSKPQPSKTQVPNTKKRKSMDDPVGGKTFKPALESQSDISSVKAPRKDAAGKPLRKLQKTSISKTAPSNRRNGARSHRQPTPGKSEARADSPQSVSPPPSGPFTGLEYTKPSSQARRITTEVAEVRMTTYSPIFSADGDDIPPTPKLPASVRLASGEVVHIPAPRAIANTSSGNATKSQQARDHASKLTKARPTPSPQKSVEERKIPCPKQDGEKKQA
jgi:hypothetical protein